MGSGATPSSEVDSTPDAVWIELRRIHWPSWLAGGIVAAALLTEQPPFVYFLVAFVQPGFIDPTDLLLLGEPPALVASTIYVAECPIRRIVKQRQFSLKGFLLAVAAVALVVSCVVHQYRSWQAIERHSFVDLALPPLLFAPWPVRLALLFGTFCLAYAMIEAAWWGVRKATRFMTSNWDRSDGSDAR